MYAQLMLLGQSLFAQSMNEWLDDNPLILSLIFFAIGGVLIAFGVFGLMSGKARGKYGAQYQGGMANLISVVRLVGGLGCCGFALYKLLM